MSVEQIKTAIVQLVFEERAELAAKLDEVLREVEDDIAAGGLRDMP